jgi:DNA-binding CsgD family transcriptional regulator
MGQGPDTSLALGRLNAAERADLGLLAQGHTAKSIANLTGRSVGAVNERLREARRKTGVGSSRELARMFAAQENRDELIGVARRLDRGTDLPTPAKSNRRWKGVAVVSLSIIGAAAAIAFAAQPASQVGPTSGGGPSNAAEMSNFPTPKQLHDRVLAEKRDESWAPGIETALGKWFADTPAVAGVARVTRIRCGDTTCEIVGTFAPMETDQKLNDAMRPMQGKPFDDAIAALGLKSEGASFAGGNDREGSFAMFVARK